ncbi:MAG: hypothetical protein JXB26_01280 [Candidatus Aminicenantes bacterium]|nr:hypothetical protein [Candidatus Aminicenantes bacterium]
MEELEILKKLDTVKAPPGFEKRVMVRLAERKNHKPRFSTLKLSLAGGFAGLLVCFIVLNFVILPQRTSRESADLEKGGSSYIRKVDQLESGPVLSIIEQVNYRRELRSRSLQPRTVYILEQVSDETMATIKY